MVFAEVTYLSKGDRINTSLAQIEGYIDQYLHISECPMSISTVQHAFEIGDIPEMHYRLIAASGKEFGLPVLTNDQNINESKHIETIW